MADDNKPTETKAPAKPEAARPTPNVGLWIGAGVGAGIGSAALAAALLYATRNRTKKSQGKD